MKTSRLEIHHNIHLDDNLLGLLNKLLTKEKVLMATMQDLIAHIQNQSTVEDGVISLLNQVSQQLKDALAVGDPVAIQSAIDQIDANTKKLSDAVVANTSAGAPPQTPPSTEPGPTSPV